MKVKFEGGLDIEKALAALGDKRMIRAVSNRALDRAAEPIAERARELAPVHDGFLRKSIKVGARALGAKQRKFRKSEVGQDRVERYVGIDDKVRPARAPKTDVRRKRKEGGSSGGAVGFYSQVVEYGLADNPAQPFMRPAWDQKKQVAFDKIAGELKSEIAKVAKREAAKTARLAKKAGK